MLIFFAKGPEDVGASEPFGNHWHTALESTPFVSPIVISFRSKMPPAVSERRSSGLHDDVRDWTGERMADRMSIDSSRRSN